MRIRFHQLDVCWFIFLLNFEFFKFCIWCTDASGTMFDGTQFPQFLTEMNETKTIRQLFKCSTTLFLSTSRSDEAFGRNTARKQVIRTVRVSAVFLNLRPNAWPDRIELKRCLIERQKSYRMMCMLMKFAYKLGKLSWFIRRTFPRISPDWWMNEMTG